MPEPIPDLPADVPIVAFTSGKGGCGKTTIAVNFANILFQSGQKVLLADFDLANRGCSGLFGDWINTPEHYLTTTLLLRSADLACHPVLEMKPGLFLVPASSIREPSWNPEGVALGELVKLLRARLQALARQVGAACVILDCFCGIDVVTTAAAGVADDTLLVNEPDIVTFSGALTLLNHLRTAFDGEARQPNLHFVVNRLRSTLTVRDLTKLYQENLEKEVSEIVLVHFPYHPRIFDTFGRYPLVSDLLPGSLFTRKLELLSYLLFKGRADSLLKPSVAVWSKEKIRSIYFRSIDRTTVDSQFLVEKFTNFPLQLGLLLLAAFGAFRTVPLSPLVAWGWLLFFATALAVVVATSLINGCWLAARLHFSLAMFRLRLSRTQKTGWQRYWMNAGVMGSFISGSLMALSSVALLVSLAIGAGQFADGAFNLGLIADKAPTLRERMLELALNTVVRTVDLRNLTVNASLSGIGEADGLLKLTSAEWLERRALIGGTVFDRSSLYLTGELSRVTLQGSSIYAMRSGGVLTVNDCNLQGCQLGGKFLINHCLLTDCAISGNGIDNSRLADCTFNRCRILDGPRGEGTTMTGLTVERSKFVNCTWPRPIYFSNSTFKLVELEMSYRTVKANSMHDPELMGFQGCEVSEMKIVAPANITGLLWWTPGAPARGILLEGKVDWVSDEAFQRATKGLTFSSQLDKVREKAVEIWARADLVEMLILANNPAAFEEAAKISGELIVSARKERAVRLEGEALMLTLMLTLIEGKTGEALTAARDNWERWLTGNPDVKLADDWSWATWDRYAMRLTLNETQRHRLKLIRDVATSADRFKRPPNANVPRVDAHLLTSEWEVPQKLPEPSKASLEGGEQKSRRPEAVPVR